MLGFEEGLILCPLAAYFADDDSVGAGAGDGEDAFDGLAGGFVAEAEGAVVHGQDVVGVHVIRHGPGLLGGGVGGDVGVVATDADDGEIDLADVLVVLVIGGVAAVEDAAFAGFEEE